MLARRAFSVIQDTSGHALWCSKQNIHIPHPTNLHLFERETTFAQHLLPVRNASEETKMQAATATGEILVVVSSLFLGH